MRIPDVKNGRANRKQPRDSILAVVLVLVVAIIAGIMVGNWISWKRSSQDRLAVLDEYNGLGPRTGLTGDVSLTVTPVSMTIHYGEPVKVELVLTNRTNRTLLLNGWLTPIPATLGNNQYPIRVMVSTHGSSVQYTGNAILSPPHKAKDFFSLAPGASRKISVDLSLGAGGGRWNIGSPGVYHFDVWYQTYLTGRYIGVKAWTGMTNHVVVTATVVP